VAPPFRSVEFDILFGNGIDKLGCLLDAAESLGIVERKGSWYNKGETKIAQGRKSSIETLKSDPKLLNEIESEVKTILAARSNRRDFPTNGAISEFGIDDQENEFNMAGMEDH
jgi:recombination protein RecA